MKAFKYLLSFLLVFGLFMGGVAQATITLNFPDVSVQHNNAVAIATLFELGVVSGDGSTGNFAPGRILNRAEYAKMIVEAKGWDLSDVKCTKIFPDLDCSQWYGKYIVKANQEGIIQGTGDGRAEPSRQVLMAEALAMTMRSFGVTVPAPAAGDPWFTPYVANMAGFDDRLTTHPGNGFPRSEAAQLIVNGLVSQEGFVLDEDLVEGAGAQLKQPVQEPKVVSSGDDRCKGVVINGLNFGTDSGLCEDYMTRYGNWLKPVAGNYWYDSVSGWVGKVGESGALPLHAGLSWGTVASNASNGNSGYYINGREMSNEEAVFSGIAFFAFPGDFRLDQEGNLYDEGGSWLLNYYAILAASGASGGGGIAGGTNDGSYYSNWNTGVSVGNGLVSLDGHVLEIP